LNINWQSTLAPTVMLQISWHYGRLSITVSLLIPKPSIGPPKASHRRPFHQRASVRRSFV